mmetsp:Transcript_126903/g.253680  ORF Transcript_126903/g.253680 Transcript_126903/m.253680 type:complete len:362 (-) Transcript_126903:624-1709(-)
MAAQPGSHAGTLPTCVSFSDPLVHSSSPRAVTEPACSYHSRRRRQDSEEDEDIFDKSGKYRVMLGMQVLVFLAYIRSLHASRNEEQKGTIQNQSHQAGCPQHIQDFLLFSVIHVHFQVPRRHPTPGIEAQRVHKKQYAKNEIASNDAGDEPPENLQAHECCPPIYRTLLRQDDFLYDKLKIFAHCHVTVPWLVRLGRAPAWFLLLEALRACGAFEVFQVNRRKVTLAHGNVRVEAEITSSFNIELRHSKIVCIVGPEFLELLATCAEVLHHFPDEMAVQKAGIGVQVRKEECNFQEKAKARVHDENLDVFNEKHTQDNSEHELVFSQSKHLSFQSKCHRLVEELEWNWKDHAHYLVVCVQA